MKELCVTTDVMDDLIFAGRHLTKDDLDAMMAYCASLGAKRHEWCVDTSWALYDDDGPLGFDLLAEAAEAAHRHGMRFDAFYKPFEGALWHPGNLLPNSFPKIDGVPFLDEPYGLIAAARPFLAKRPDALMSRRPDEDLDPGGRIDAIRLVKNDTKPAPFTVDDVSIWTSHRNGGFKRYSGPVQWRESVQWRLCYPYDDAERRVVALHALELPKDTRFVKVKVEKTGGSGSFINDIENIVELANENGQIIPSMPDSRHLDNETRFKRLTQIARLGLSRYCNHPEVKEILRDRDRFLSECDGMVAFSSWWDKVDLMEVGEIAASRGKPRRIPGALNPAYPEVRQHWLDEIRFCADRGVDGVNIRVASHNRPHEPWAYGFNQPTLAQSEHPGDAGDARRVNGDAFTQFLRDARDLLHDDGKELGVHVHSEYFRHCDNAADNSSIVRNIDFQWETWVREIADYAEFRGASFLRPENVREVVDRIGHVTREAGIPFIYQSGRSPSVVHFDGPHPTMFWETRWLRNHPAVTCYNLYEIAYFSRMNKNDQWEGSPDVAELIRENWNH